MQQQNIESQDQWFKYAKTEAKPRSIPANPSQTYMGKGWTDWYDWLGKTHKIQG